MTVRVFVSTDDPRLEMDQLSQYHISDIDSSGDPQYFGFEDKEGGWYILQLTGGTDARYAVGSSDYAAAWANRVPPGVTYAYYADVF